MWFSLLLTTTKILMGISLLSQTLMMNYLKPVRFPKKLRVTDGLSRVPATHVGGLKKEDRFHFLLSPSCFDKERMALNGARCMSSHFVCCDSNYSSSSKKSEVSHFGE